MIKRAAFGAVMAVSAVSIGTAGGALAHHPTGGMAPTTLWHGLLSGVGHPILGLDHLAFVIGVGLLAGIAGLGLLLPLLFVAAMTAGLALHVAGVDLPHAEVLVAVSVLAMGLAVWSVNDAGATGTKGRAIGLAFAATGLLHGYVLGETAIGAEATPIAGYIAGLAATQMTIAAIAWKLSCLDAPSAALLTPARVRIAAAVIAVVGAVQLGLAGAA